MVSLYIFRRHPLLLCFSVHRRYVSEWNFVFARYKCNDHLLILQIVCHTLLPFLNCRYRFELQITERREQRSNLERTYRTTLLQAVIWENDRKGGRARARWWVAMCLTVLAREGCVCQNQTNKTGNYIWRRFLKYTSVARSEMRYRILRPSKGRYVHMYLSPKGVRQKSANTDAHMIGN